MHWLDWCIMVIPVLGILGVAIYSRHYVRSVVDFLAAGRVAGRYVLAVGDLAMALSVITLIGSCEANFKTGFAVGYWGAIASQVSIVLSLTGFCLYRFRETKALSMGQFLEMRYNRTFRIFAAFLRTIAEMLTNAIGPAVAARFFIYFLGFPQYVNIFGYQVQSFLFVTLIVIIMALVVMWTGGRIALLITDSIQGVLSYPIFVIILGWIILRFSWTEEIAPVMLDRAAGESFFNPFDVQNLRDFNLFSTFVVLVSVILNRASWVGNDTSSSGKTPHEQKMAGVLGSWRNGFSFIMMMLVAMVVIVVMAHDNFSERAHLIRTEISDRVAEEILPEETRGMLHDAITALPVQHHVIGEDAPLSQENNHDVMYLETAHNVLGHDAAGNEKFKLFTTLFNQVRVTITLRQMLPVGIAGLFCLLMVMLMLSTDDGRIFNSAASIVQDIILPFRKTPFTPEQHIRCLKICSLFVCVFFFCCAFVPPMDYIQMFISVVGAIWTGGAGPVMVFGLYSKFGNTAGAYASLFAGSGISVSGVLLQRNWAGSVYPFLVRHGWVEGVGSFLETVSAPFHPLVVWEMSPVTFPINSYEIYFLAMLFGTVAYVVVSLIAYRKPYNLDRLLHRGEYAIDGERKIKIKWTFGNIISNLIGITPEYSRGDKFVAWLVFGYSIVFGLVCNFFTVLIWNLGYFFSWIPWDPWPKEWWGYYYLITGVVIESVIGVCSTVWFMWGGTRDVFRLFRDLRLRKDNPLDNGSVVGQVSAADAAVFKQGNKKLED